MQKRKSQLWWSKTGIKEQRFIKCWSLAPIATQNPWKRTIRPHPSPRPITITNIDLTPITTSNRAKKQLSSHNKWNQIQVNKIYHSKWHHPSSAEYRWGTAQWCESCRPVEKQRYKTQAGKKTKSAQRSHSRSCRFLVFLQWGTQK